MNTDATVRQGSRIEDRGWWIENHPRSTILDLRSSILNAATGNMACELRQGLTATPKQLPCQWFYDEAGSRLFEQICELPEYYLTRTENSILQRQAAALIDLCPAPLELVELGSGTAAKTRSLIEASLRRQPALDYYPIDVSTAALQVAAHRLLATFDQLRVIALVGDFTAGLDYLAQQPGGARLVLFLGSTIGNFTEEQLDEFFTLLRARLRPGDRFLLGFDLLKDPALLIPAYDDAQGVTAQFNLNLLARLNRELGADFDLSNFRHRAVFNARRSRIEMYLVSQRAQVVHIPGLELDVSFAAGEAIHTENSYKHAQENMEKLLEYHGFVRVAAFTDAARMFCLLLLR